MTPLAVTGLTAVSPVGDDAAETVAAIRAGLCGLAQHPYFDVITPDPGWDEEEELAAGLVHGMDPWLDGPDRLYALALRVLAALVETTRLRRAELHKTALLLALPHPDPVVARWQLGAVFAEELCRRAGWPRLPVARSKESGHTAALELLADAAELLAARQVERCVVLAVDSYHDEARLTHLDEHYHLRSQRSPDGFLPGEAAVAFLVERPGPRPALLTVHGPSLGTEARTIGGDYPSTSRGLEQALAPVIAGAPPRWVLCDLNGQSYRHQEWGTLLARMAPALDGIERLVHPADAVGDVGAATGGLLLACAWQAFARGWAPEKHALLWASAEAGQRAAVRVER